MSRPLVLLAEDDPVSALFIAEALQELGLAVERCADGEAALARARGRHFDLLLLDCRMPGMGAERILEALRADPAAASRASPALATSAELSARLRARLLESGFLVALDKPLEVTELEQALREVWPARAPACLLDDDAGLRTSGSREALWALRGLFADELQALEAQIDGLLDDRDTLVERLHRLRASCGFCGADVLDRACTALSRASRKTGSAAADTAIAHFREALRATLDALRSESPPQA